MREASRWEWWHFGLRTSPCCLARRVRIIKVFPSDKADSVECDLDPDPSALQLQELERNPPSH